jgi:hypothetical protein
MTQFGFFFSLRMLALPWLSLFTMEKTIGATGHPSSWSSKKVNHQENWSYNYQHPATYVLQSKAMSIRFK